MSTLLEMIKRKQSIDDTIHNTMSEYLNTTFKTELNNELRKCSLASVKIVRYHHEHQAIEVVIHMREVNPLTCKVIKEIEYNSLFTSINSNFIFHSCNGVYQDYFKTDNFILDKLNTFLNTQL